MVTENGENNMWNTVATKNVVQIGFSPATLNRHGAVVLSVTNNCFSYDALAKS